MGGQDARDRGDNGQQGGNDIESHLEAVDDSMELDGNKENAGMAVCTVMKKIIADRSAMTYAHCNVVFVEWLLESECQLNVL